MRLSVVYSLVCLYVRSFQALISPVIGKNLLMNAPLNYKDIFIINLFVFCMLCSRFKGVDVVPN